MEFGCPYDSLGIRIETADHLILHWLSKECSRSEFVVFCLMSNRIAIDFIHCLLCSCCFTCVSASSEDKEYMLLFYSSVRREFLFDNSEGCCSDAVCMRCFV